MSKHSYIIDCDCKRCAKERTRRTVQSNLHGKPREQALYNAIFSRNTRKPCKASRAEQHARYIDCGPAAWDDRD
jgi:hypothetical protein